MRKVSKSRTEDDVVSSTNGSVQNDEQVNTNNGDDEDKASKHSWESDDDEKVSNSKSSAKKSKKGKKKKADKKEKPKDEEDDDATEEEYEVEKVVDSKKIKGKLHYLIRWKGYSASSDSWEPANTLSCPDLIAKFEENESSKTKESKSPGKKGKKRKAGKTEAKPSKKPKQDWDSENADDKAEYEVERILEVHHKKNGKRDFLIHWKGWSTKFDSWEPEDNLNCPELIKKFMDKVESARSVDSRNLRVAPESTNRFTLQPQSTGRRLSKRRGQRQRVRYDGAE